MELLPSRPNHDNSQPARRSDDRSGRGYRGDAISETGEDSPGSVFNLGDLLRRYWLLLIALMILGASAGFSSVVLSSPMYKTRLLLEVQSVNEAFTKNSMDAMAFDATEVGIQTQIN